VFDRNEVSDLQIRELLHVLRAVEVPWILLPGNHDPFTVESVWERMMRVGCPPHVHVVKSGDPVLLCDGRLAVIPAPLTRRHQYEDPTEAFATTATPAGAIRVGLAHGSVRNRLHEAAEQYNMISDTTAVDARLDYLALGDWHGAIEIAERTWYAGTPEPDSFRQPESGYVLLVDLPGVGQAPKVARVCTGHYRWYDLEATLQSPDAGEALGTAVGAVDKPRDSAVVQLTLRGAVSLAERATVSDRVAELEAEVQVLRANLEELIAAPSEADLDEMGRQGFIGIVVQRLRTVHGDASNPDQKHAATALQRLYIEHVLGGRS
jgi:DNA repair exonuclease SbcCD nuclease subunit